MVTASRREGRQTGIDPGAHESFTMDELALLDAPAGSWLGRLLSALVDANKVCAPSLRYSLGSAGHALYACRDVFSKAFNKSISSHLKLVRLS